MLVLFVNFHNTQGFKAIKLFIGCNPQQQRNHKEFTDVITSETLAYKIG